MKHLLNFLKSLLGSYGFVIHRLPYTFDSYYLNRFLNSVMKKLASILIVAASIFINLLVFVTEKFHLFFGR